MAVFSCNLVDYHKLSTHKFHPTGIIGSVLGAIAVVLLLRVTRLEKGRRPV